MKTVSEERYLLLIRDDFICGDESMNDSSILFSRLLKFHARIHDKDVI